MSIDKSHLILYKNPKLYNGSRYVYYQDNRDYDNWLSLSSYQTYSKDVVFKSLEENITINAFIDNVDEYTYGSITLNKTKYYFFVDRVSTDAYNQTTISYTIDWWATKWFAVTCTKANLKRSSVKPEYMAQPFSPLAPDFNKGQGIGEEGGCIVFSYTASLGSGSNKDCMKWGVIDFSEADGIQMIETGAWSKYLGDTLTAGDMLGVFVVPCFRANDFKDAGWSTVTAEVENKTVTWYTTNDLTGTSLMPSKIIVFNEPLYTDDTTVMGITDWNGTTIWECPYGVSIDKFYLTLSLSARTCQIRFKFDNEFANENIGKGFSYACRECAIVIDQQVEYTWRERESEIRMRELQAIKQVWSNGSDAIQGAGFGMAFGGQVGAMAGGFAGALNTFSSAMMNIELLPKIQRTQDLKYERMQDLVSIVGESITPIYNLLKSDEKRYFLPLTKIEYNDFSTTNIGTYLERYYGIRGVTEGSEIWYFLMDYSDTDDSINYETIRSSLFTNATKTLKKITYTNGSWSTPTSDVFYIITRLTTGSGPLSNQTSYSMTDTLKHYYPELVLTSGIMMMFRSERTDENYNIFMYDGSSWKEMISLKPTLSPTDTSNVKHKTYRPTNIEYYFINQRFDYLMNVYRLTMDGATANRMNTDIKTNGYYCDEITPLLQQYFGVGKIVQADNVVVEGACSLQAKQQIVYRLSNGVEFV